LGIPPPNDWWFRIREVSPKCPETCRFGNYYQAIYSDQPAEVTTILVVNSKGILPKNERKIQVKDLSLMLTAPFCKWVVLGCGLNGYHPTPNLTGYDWST